MFDHFGYSVAEVSTSKAFYDHALAPLGIKVIMHITNDMTGGHGEHFGYGVDKPQFWIGSGGKHSPGVHVAFSANTRADVDAFYAAAMAAGATDNGAPGLRPHYHENYYGAFVLDPDGHNIEAVCHLPA